MPRCNNCKGLARLPKPKPKPLKPTLRLKLRSKPRVSYRRK